MGLLLVRLVNVTLMDEVNSYDLPGSSAANDALFKQSSSIVVPDGSCHFVGAKGPVYPQDVCQVQGAFMPQNPIGSPVWLYMPWSSNHSPFKASLPAQSFLIQPAYTQDHGTVLSHQAQHPIQLPCTPNFESLAQSVLFQRQLRGVATRAWHLRA